MKIVLVRSFDPGGDNLTDAQRPAAGNVDGAVDLRGVRLGATFGNGGTDFIDDNLLARANFALQPAGRNFLLPCDECILALLLDLLRHRLAERVRRGSGDRLIFEATDPINLG